MRRRIPESGFTIIELMIAISVFSVTLVICMAAFIFIGRMYYKGWVTTQTQAAARSVIDDITRELQLGLSRPIIAESPVGDVSYLCIGKVRYRYVLGRQLSDTDSDADKTATVGLVTEITPSVSSDETQCRTRNDADSATVKELLSRGMRLSALVVDETAVSNTYAVTVEVAAAPSSADLTNAAGDDLGTAEQAVPDGQLSCRTDGGIINTQFCNVTRLETTVTRRN